MTFRSFVILAAMRTGSNLLEECLNTVPGLRCHGELFNPHFIGGPNRAPFGGFDVKSRNADPLRMLNAVKTADGMNGFRLFQDHDPRAVRAVLEDASVAKIVLTRRPIDSYVSLKIARATGQWWMGQMAGARTARVAFDEREFTDYLEDLKAFYAEIRGALQRSGQAAFHIDYADLQDQDVLSGIARFLGADDVPDPGRIKAKVQNPAPIAELLTNPDVAESFVEADLFSPRGQEPGRGPGVRDFVATKEGVLYMPIPGAAPDPIAADLDGNRGLTRKDLRRWMRSQPGHRAVTVLRHPLDRAHDAFARIVWNDDSPMPDLRDTLCRHQGIALPDIGGRAAADLADYRHAFLAFLTFLAGNLSGQSALPVQRIWASQHLFVEAMATLRPADILLREGEQASGMADLAGIQDRTWPTSGPFTIADVATEDVRQACQKAYRRDYVMFGFRP